jgi:hypothetical protein
MPRPLLLLIDFQKVFDAMAAAQQPERGRQCAALAGILAPQSHVLVSAAHLLAEPRRL